MDVLKLASPMALVIKNPSASAGNRRHEFNTLGQEDSPEKEMATHSSILSWNIL